MPRVLNKKVSGVPPGAVYVGRPTKWGNPIRLIREADRTQVLVEYRAFLAANPQLIAQARQKLRGKDLVCWCAPLACHADVLMEAANSDSPLPATTKDPFAL